MSKTSEPSKMFLHRADKIGSPRRLRRNSSKNCFKLASRKPRAARAKFFIPTSDSR